MCVEAEYFEMQKATAKKLCAAVKKAKQPRRECCVTPGCRNQRKADRRLCSKCDNRKWRVNNPITYAYHNLKNHAKARGIQFLLTIDEFKKFCHETNYHIERGQDPDSLTVDRKDPDGPYSYDNIRPLGHYANSIRADNPELDPVTPPPPLDDNDAPFG